MPADLVFTAGKARTELRSEEHTSELQSHVNLVCRLLLEKKTAVLLVSSDLDEVMALSDRIAVMYRGRVIATVTPDTPREEIGLLMAGVQEAQSGRGTDGAGQ